MTSIPTKKKPPEATEGFVESILNRTIPMGKVTEVHLDVKALDRFDVLLSIAGEATERLSQLATLFRT